MAVSVPVRSFSAGRRAALPLILVVIGLVALMLLTTGETPVDPWAPVKASAPPPPAPRRDPLPVAPSTTPIKHIVYIVKENRTYDNLFGRFPEGDGARAGKALDGSTIRLGPLPDKQVDLQHNHFWAVKDINDGAMNGFSHQGQGRT